jgi:type VI secretion system secreted protein Hcp
MAFFSFLQLDSVKGTCTEDGHVDWIDVKEFQYALQHTLAGDMHSQGAITGGIVQQGDLVIKKSIDASSPVLSLYCCQSKNIGKAVMDVCRMINGKKVAYIKYTMENVAITSLAPGGKAGEKGDDVPVETITLRPSVIRWEYVPTGQDGPKAAVKHGWNFPKQSQDC